MDKIEKRELLNSTAKSLFSVVPYVGGILNEVIYDLRGRIKQERINNFVVLLSDYFGKNPILNEEVLASEDFGDLFESVLKRVALTKSQKKHTRFRDILINYINHPYPEVDDTEIFLDLVSYLNDTAIIILKHHQIFDEEFNLKQNQYNQLNEEVIRQQIDFNSQRTNGEQENYSSKVLKIRQLDDEFDKLKKTKTADFYSISEDSFLYHKQTLFARGLLSDVGIGAIGNHPFFNMAITEFGRQFLTYIKDYKSD